MSDLGEKGSPIHMKLVSEASPGKLAAMILLTLAPVAIAVLMQNPALRQALQMKLWKRMEIINTNAASYFDTAAKQAKFKYELAKM